MAGINELLDRRETTAIDKRSQTTSTTSTKKTLALVWATLLNRRLVSDPIGSLQHRQFEVDMADLTDQQLRIGLEKTKDFTGFFTLPAFREMCQLTPADFGLPDARTAMYEACNAPYPKDQHLWSHPAVYLAGCEVGWFDMQNRSERELLPLYSHAYDQLVRRVMDGESLTMPIRRALPKEVHVPATPETAKANLKKLKELLS